MKFRRSVYFAISALAILQISSSQKTQQAKVTTTTTMESCKNKPAPLVRAQNHCKSTTHSHTMAKKDTNSTDKVAAMNHTKSDMLSECYPLCILKTLNMVDSNMVPIENRMKTMMTTVALISDPKSKERMNNLMDACLSEYKQMTMMDHEHVQEEDHSCMATGHAHKNDKCTGAAKLISCMNKGLPCPFFDDIKM